MINVNIVEIGILLIAIVVHEFGHYAAYKIFKKKPKIRFTWWGIQIGENVYYSLTPFQAYIVNGSGIMAGAIVISTLINQWMLPYLILCSVDITNIISLLSIDRKHRKMTLLQIARIQLLEEEERLKKGL